MRLFDFPKKLYGNAVVLSHLHGQRRVPYLPEQELRELRDARLRHIVAYAARTVPYYQKLFQEIKLDPRDIKSADDLDRIPLLDKSTVRGNPRLFLSTSRKGKESTRFVTSGTTGKPTEIFHDVNSVLANIGFGQRERAVYQTFYRDTRTPKELYIVYSTSTIRKVWDIYRKWTFLPAPQDRTILSVVEPFHSIVDEINRARPDVITAYGSYLETFFKAVHARRIDIHLPRLLIYVAESMTSEGKKFIENTFRIPVLTRYNAVEVFKIGFFCEQRNGFHLHEDLCHVKIVHANGEKAKIGEKGEVVISNLVNHGTVLLNYRLGDVASISGDQCSCGRTLPVLSELDGRVEDIIFLANGEFLHPRAVWNVFKSRNEILEYQLVQHEPTRFQLKLVTVNRQNYENIIERVANDLRDLLGPSAAIECEFHEELAREGSGKFKPVLSLCKPAEYR